MERTHNAHIKELNDMIDTVKEEDRKKMEETKTEEQTFREDIKNKNLERQADGSRTWLKHLGWTNCNWIVIWTGIRSGSKK